MYTTEQFREQVYLWYDTNGITVGDPSVGRWEHAHIVPRCVGGTETVLLLKEHHYIHDLYQSREYNRQCFFQGTTRAWLYGEGFLCENWFELVELYEYYSSRHSAQNAADRWAKLTPEERSTEMSQRTLTAWSAKTDEERVTQGRRLAKARWDNTTTEERSAEARRRSGATPEERSERGRRMAGARWADATDDDRAAQVAVLGAASKARWATLTPEERSAEMSRRRRLGQERKRAMRGLDGDPHGALWAADTL